MTVNFLVDSYKRSALTSSSLPHRDDNYGHFSIKQLFNNLNYIPYIANILKNISWVQLKLSTNITIGFF